MDEEINQSLSLKANNQLSDLLTEHRQLRFYYEARISYIGDIPLLQKADLTSAD